MWNAKYKKPHGNTVRLTLQAQGLPLSNNTLFRLHFQSEHLKAFFAPKFRVVVSVLPVWVRLWVKWENGGKLNLPPHYCFRTLTHIFQQLMRSTQNEKTELITQKSRLKRRLFKVFWSECGDSNSGPPAPKAVYIIPYDDLCRFPAISSRLRILFKTLISTVSAYSTPVCSQTCGQKPLSEHPRDRGQKAVFIVCRNDADRWFGLSHCTSDKVVKQVLYARIGGAEFASL